MNKLTKGTIAAGVAAVLLLATGGTLAYWNVTSSLSGATITAGDLGITQTSAAWTLTHTSGTPVAVSGDIADVRIVPGDKLTYTGAYDITAQGNDLVISAALGDLAIAGATASASDIALAGRLTSSATYTINGASGQTATIEHNSADADTYPVVITVTLTWPYDGTPAQDNTAKTGAVTLEDFAVTIRQVDGTTGQP